MRKFFAIAFSLLLAIYTCIYVWIIVSVCLNGINEDNLFSEELDELVQDL